MTWSANILRVFRTMAIAMILSAPLVHAQQGTVDSFVPAGYSILARYDADLNGDGSPDVLLILVKNGADLDAPRPLIILFRNAPESYFLSVRSDQAVPEPVSGGIASNDGFDGIKIRKNGFVISRYGGSSTREVQRWHFRFQNGEWLLIGETDVIDSPGTDTPYYCHYCPPLKGDTCSPCKYQIDTNFVTGRQVGTIYLDKGNRVVRRTMQKHTRIRLADFYPSYWADFQW